jgi:hypothetical protein
MIFNRHVYRKEAEEGEEGGGGEAEKALPDTVEGGAADVVEAGPSPEIIAKAEKMGWTPKDQFKGDPAKWRPADEFVERGENMVPILRATVKKQERQLAELQASMKEFAEYHNKAQQRANEQALATLRAERAEAIKNGDGAAFDKVDAQIDELKKNVESKAKKEPENGEDPVFAEWLTRNKWAEDRKLQIIAKGIGDALVEDGESARGTELLDLITVEMKRRYPEKFENPRRNAAPTVEGGATPRRSGGKTFADMPAEARASCERMAKNAFAGKADEMAKFKAEYVKNYFAD